MAVLQEPERVADKHETYVDKQIDLASRRIRTHDIGAAALGLALGTLGYALTVVLLDRWLNLPSLVRQAGLIGYLIAAAAYAFAVLSRPFRRQVNPYYAARQVERAVPAAKNSVVNWLDLRDEPLPATIKTALGARAADDLSRADMDGALHDGRLGWLGGIVAGLCFTALVMLFVLRPNQFLSLVGRALAPFVSAPIARQTGLTLIQPAGGDITVPVNQAVDFRVSVQGKNPLPGADDSVRLRIKYNPADPGWEERRLEPTARDPREWAVRVASVAVQNGFVYQIIGGDATTAEHRVTVRSSPLIDGFDVVYRFRPYLRFRDQTDTKPNLEGLRGTEVALTVRTNRMVRDGWLRFDKIEGQPELPSIAAELVADQPNSLRFRFTLEKDGKYRVSFTSIEGDENQDPIPYTIRVLTDQPPQIDITRAAPDGLATNGTLQLEGKASDDFGLTKLRLCMQLLDSDKDPQPARLADKPFRDGKSFKFDDGTYPRALDYKESIPLEQLRARGGLKLDLKAGKIVEYWLEGEDNCDYPQPNVGRSKIYRVTLGDPKTDDEKKAANEQAKSEKREFDDKQDKNLGDENAAKNAAADNPPKPDQGDPKPNDDNKRPDEQPNEGPKSPDNPPKDPNQKAEEDKARDIADKLKNKVNEKNEEAKQPKGEGKPDQPKDDPKNDGNPQPPKPDAGQKGESKPDAGKPNQPQNGPQGEAKPDPKPQPGAGDKGESKPEGKPEAAPQPGETKPDQQGNDAGKPNDPNAKPEPQNKDAGKPNDPNAKPNPQNKDAGKPNDPNAKPEPQNKDAGKPNDPNAKPEPQNKDAGKPNDPNAKPNPQNKDAGKPNDPNAKPNPQNKDAGKPNPGEAKPSPKPNEPTPGESKSEAPQDGSKPGENKDGKPEGGSEKPEGGNTPGANAPSSPPGSKDNAKPNTPNAQQPQKNADGQGGEGGKGGSKGEQTKTGPKNDPTKNDPKAKPDANDKGIDGQAGKTPSGQPDKGPAPPDAEVRPGEAKDRGQPEPAPAKGEGKPDPNSPGQPGGTDEKGDLQDAPKGSGPGPKPKDEPTTDGTPGGTGPKKDGTPDSKKSADELVKSAAELAKKLAEQAKDLKNASPTDPKAAEQLGKKLAESAADQQRLADALRNADPKLKQELADNLNKLREEMKKNEAGKPQGEQKPSDIIDELSKELAKQPEKGQPDDDATNPGDRNRKGAGSGDGSDVRDRPIGDRSQRPPEAGPGSKPDPRNAARAGEMLLEEFRKKVDRKMLEELKMTEAEYAEFLRSYEAMVNRQKAAAAATDKADRERGATAGGSAANTTAKRVRGGTDKPGDLNRGGAALAPPEMREGYKGFTEDVSKSGTTPKDKK